jgi:hypothetical protein
MKKLLEFLQQQDGAFCALQYAIVGGFSTFWVCWTIISLKNNVCSDCPTGLGILLSAMLACKVWKDISDNKVPPAN